MRKVTKTGVKKKAWVAFSKYIRVRDCIKTTGFPDKGQCVTCGRFFPFSELQAGHAIGGRNNSILFDEELVNAQCRGCNSYGNGKYAEYSVWFIEKYGLKRWEEKVKRSEEIVKYSLEDYEDIFKKYTKKLECLLN